ncbi:MAG: PQQ-dependent sugar dehydrogenase [Pontibacterium sp.]
MKSLPWLVAILFSATVFADISIKTQTIAQGLKYPWGMTWLNDTHLVVTEKSVGGWVINTSNGTKEQITGWPTDIAVIGQGGLLDVVADTQFFENQTLYFSYSHQNTNQDTTTQVASAQLVNNRLVNWKVLFTALPYSDSGHHFGSRLALKNDHLFITVGDRGERHRAQDLADNAGKVHRIHTDGSVPADNPFLNMQTSSGQAIPATIFSYGHRNPQGMYIDAQGNVWVHEHGPRGGDELNLVLKGKNYGWPVITYGKEYWGPSIGEGTQKPGMEQPKYYYVPSIAPSGLVRYEANLFEAWQGDFLIGALKERHLNRLSIEAQPKDEKITSAYQEQRLLGDLDARIRDVEVDIQGAVYILTDDSNGKLIRITP